LPGIGQNPNLKDKIKLKKSTGFSSNSGSKFNIDSVIPPLPGNVQMPKLPPLPKK
jgi:hypothetical protein